MSLSKWDKISKQEGRELIDRIKYLDTMRSTGEFMAYDLHGLDLYRGTPRELRSYSIYQTNEFEELGRSLVTYVQDMFMPTLAELFAQIPKQYAYKVTAYQLNIFKNFTDVEDGQRRVEVIFYKTVNNDVVNEGPLTARQLYLEYLEQALRTPDERTGIMHHTSLGNPAYSKALRDDIKERMEAAKTMEDDELRYNIAAFLMHAFRQR